jgi:hypothetical protein
MKKKRRSPPPEEGEESSLEDDAKGKRTPLKLGPRIARLLSSSRTHTHTRPLYA